MPGKSLSCEDDILNIIGRYFPHRGQGVLVGRGDDCALLPAGRPMAVSSDLFLEDAHFRLSYATAAEIGHKALACNVSDLAACGTRPVGFTLNLGLPKKLGADWLEDFFSGMSALAKKYAVPLIGGDLSRTDKLLVSVTVFGEVIGEGAFLPRGGMMPGDAIFVVGKIGLGRVGLHVMEKMGRAAMKEWPESCAQLLTPDPKVEAGLMLARAGKNSRPPALMDVSDGLVRDLPRLLGLAGENGTTARDREGLGANLVIPADSLPAEVMRWAALNDADPVREALYGGDDYCLLGACAPDMLPVLRAAVPGFWEIGTVVEGGVITCNGKSLADMVGFDHFSS